MPKPVDLAKKILISPKVKRFIDLNTDLGQVRDRAFYSKSHYELLNQVTSVSIPCAVHDGDPKEILAMIRKAKEYNCVIGAHIGYPDPARFGYEPMALDAEELAAWIFVQIGAFQALLRSERLDIEHVRPHGALYSALQDNPEIAMTVGKTLQKINPWMTLIGPMGSVLSQVEEEAKIKTAAEIYVGKRYTADGRLSKHRPHEFLPPQGVMDQVRQLINNSTLTTEDGKSIAVKFKTLHLSPTLPHVVDVSQKASQMLIQAVSLPLADAGASGWL
jgi:5-oxoprolinase (ATP-hydrolysing) subunit A